MKYTKFSEFIRESEEIDELSPERRKELDELFLELTDEEIDHLGQIMFAYFSDEEDDDEDDDDEEYPEAEFDVDALNAMIDAIGSDSYNVIATIISSESETLEDIFDEIDSIIDVDLTESLLEALVSKRMKVGNMNRARVFMKVTRAKLRATKANRRVQLRKTKHKRKAKYRKNKHRIKAYAKSRATAIKSGKHIVKRRR